MISSINMVVEVLVVVCVVVVVVEEAAAAVVAPPSTCNKRFHLMKSHQGKTKTEELPMQRLCRSRSDFKGFGRGFAAGQRQLDMGITTSQLAGVFLESVIWKADIYSLWAVILSVKQLVN
ncbi:hypothetical protein NC652_030951 [Populus alba x Populus x berolinensis]|nr:hypothetical protein NC652_030951 [Populus alba x Populus x berolinensis]